jgi:peptide chain release factor 3
MEHLLAEDIVQAFQVKGHQSAVPLLGAVGPLQFEVLQYRLKEDTARKPMEAAPWKLLRWLRLPADVGPWKR